MKKAVKKKPAVKKLAPKKPVVQKEPTREELRKILATEPTGSDKAIKAATKMLDHLEKDAEVVRTQKVKYFPPVRREEVVAPAVKAIEKPDEKPVRRLHPDEKKLVKKKVQAQTPQVTLGELCKELKKDPTEVRKMLREKKVQKPGAQWSWNKDDVKNITVIKKLIKELK